jgi:hypothetical protein
MPFKDIKKARECSRRYQAKRRAADLEAARERDRVYNAKRRAQDKVLGITRQRKTKRSDYEHRRSMKRYYGITPETYDGMVKAQKGKCAICESTDTGSKRRLCVDHRRADGKVRGLLCSKCNLAIGLFSENLIIMRSAIFYLLVHR